MEEEAILFFNNTGADYVIALVVFGIVLSGTFILRHFVIQKLSVNSSKSQMNIKDKVLDIIKRIRPSLYVFLSVFAALLTLNIPHIFKKILIAVAVLWVGFRVAQQVSVISQYALGKALGTDKATNKEILNLFGLIIQWAFYLFVVLFALSNLGVQVNSLIAGLGIGGIAIAFAFQKVLSNLLSTFAIFSDKPFEVGDYIVSGDIEGNIEHIGLRTTRLRATSGEELVVLNEDLTSNIIHNYNNLQRRRIDTKVYVDIHTPTEKLKVIPSLIKQAVDSANGASDITLVRGVMTSVTKYGYEYNIVANTQELDLTKMLIQKENILVNVTDLLKNEGISLTRIVMCDK